MKKRFAVLDIETLGTPEDCGTTHIAMPNAALVIWNGIEELPYIIYMSFDVQEQLFKGAKVTSGTIAFWLQEALNGNEAAKKIISSLNSPSPIATVWGRISEGKTYSFKNNKELFNFVTGYAASNGLTDIRMYGNGPEFDMTIYSSNSYHAHEGKKSDLPWKFWKVRSARNVGEYNFSTVQDLGSTKKDAEVWAHRIFKEQGIMLVSDHTPSKHNPIYDALVEAYIIGTTLES